MRISVLGVVVLTLSLSIVTGCGSENEGEKLGRQVDEIIERAEEKAQDVEEEAERLGEEIEEDVERMGEDVEESYE